jgi:hypothetical protein
LWMDRSTPFCFHVMWRHDCVGMLRDRAFDGGGSTLDASFDGVSISR